MDQQMWDNVTGVTYRNAVAEMGAIDQAIKGYHHRGFDNADECSAFAHDHNLDLMVYSNMHSAFRQVDHRGSLLTHSAWGQQYKDILYYLQEGEGDKIKKVCWEPDAYESRLNAYVTGESRIGTREPLNERNYFAPVGYRNPLTGRFNHARPFKYFAKETGADTTPIYTLIQHLAGENEKYLLAWLRQKMCYPTKKTDVMPIIIGGQGTGKTLFANHVCSALFGVDNVVVDVNFNGAARFNTEFADALMVCIEEKALDDKYNVLSILKSLVTSTTIRREAKGVDATYQDSFLEIMLTTNEMVPVRFDSQKQRRFMVMESDPAFVRVKEGERVTETSRLADSVFTALTGKPAIGEAIGPAIYDNPDLVQQFKWELLNNEELANTSPKDFVETDAFRRCFNVPRSTETITTEGIIRALAPFAKASLDAQMAVTTLPDGELLASVAGSNEGMLYVRGVGGRPDRVAFNRMLFFRDEKRGDILSHATIDQCIYRSSDWLEELGLKALPTSEPPSGGFKNVPPKHRLSPTLYFALSDNAKILQGESRFVAKKVENVIDIRAKNPTLQRFNDRFMPDDDGEFEVVNPLKPGTARKSENVLRMDTFLLEADEASSVIKGIEEQRMEEQDTWQAEELYAERLKLQKSEAMRLLNEGIANRVVYSGSKSYHILVRVEDAPKTMEERRWLDAYLKTTLSNRLVFDMSTSDAARLTRSPITKTRTVKKKNVTIIGKQRLIAEKPDNVYNVVWRPIYNRWLQAPKDRYEIGNRKLLPTKDIYKEATHAMLDGTFWSNKKWDGQRNTVFFAAYRLMRSQGLTEKDIWANIADDIKVYYKQNEVRYWLTRRDCDLIKAIEEDFKEPVPDVAEEQVVDDWSDYENF